MPPLLAVRDHVAVRCAGAGIALPAVMKCACVLIALVACSSNQAAPDGSLDGVGIDGDSSMPGPIVHSFDGEVGAGLAACPTTAGHCDRPEMNVAANGSQVVQVTSRSVNVYSYTGMLLTSTPLATFIT